MYVTVGKPESGPHGMGYVTSGSKPRRAFWSIVLSIGFIGTVTVRDLKIFKSFWRAWLEDKNRFVDPFVKLCVNASSNIFLIRPLSKWKLKKEIQIGTFRESFFVWIRFILYHYQIECHIKVLYPKRRPILWLSLNLRYYRTFLQLYVDKSDINRRNDR